MVHKYFTISNLYICNFLNEKIKISILYDPVILLVKIYPRNKLKCKQIYMYAPKVNTALFTYMHKKLKINVQLQRNYFKELDIS